MTNSSYKNWNKLCALGLRQLQARSNSKRMTAQNKAKTVTGQAKRQNLLLNLPFCVRQMSTVDFGCGPEVSEGLHMALGFSHYRFIINAHSLPVCRNNLSIILSQARHYSSLSSSLQSVHLLSSLSLFPTPNFSILMHLLITSHSLICLTCMCRHVWFLSLYNIFNTSIHHPNTHLTQQKWLLGNTHLESKSHNGI